MNEEEGEKVQVQELAQQIEQIVEATKMELEQEPQDQDIDIMLSLLEISPRSPPPLE